LPYKGIIGRVGEGEFFTGHSNTLSWHTLKQNNSLGVIDDLPRDHYKGHHRYHG